ncbi:MAG: hypothetical protein GX780_01290, partial [Campylobacteraceae bacterium]|nr:hypothetical protein [Campylobacteraceae bacterium]
TIEWLKNQYETPDERHSFIFILFRLENCGIVQNQLDCLKYHDWEKKILNLLTAKMPDCLFLSKWNESHYLACYDIQAQAENIVDKVFQKLINFEDGSVPILETYIWQSKKASLVKTVDTLDLISYSQDCFKDLNNLNIIVMHSEDDSLTESEKIFRMLYACIAPKTTLKLQNIYKGLCINTNSRVLKEKDGMLYLECQPAQAYAIKESRNVTILSDMFIRDIHASVKLVDIEKKFIVIDEFFYLDTSANSRQYTRVQTRVRTPIALKQERLQFQGDIIDISLKSLAFATRLPISELSYHKGVTFNFHLPDETLEEGFCSIKGTGEIVYTGILNSRENKIVIMMNLKDPYDSYLLRYMYMRQKELIEELKNISKSNC